LGTGVTLTIAIVTDSTSDLPPDILDEFNIYQIPADLILGNQTYQDGFDLSRNEFYKKLPHLKVPPTTAAPSSGRFQTLYESIFNQGFTEIISIHVSSALSGIFNSARLAAESFSQPIHVIDSEQLTMGLGFQVLQASLAARQNLPLHQIIKKVKSIRKRLHVYALLDTLTFIHRSGRVSWAKARIGSLLDIKPVLELKGGEVLNRGMVRSRKKGIQHLGQILQDLGSLEYLAVLHTNAEEDGKKFFKDYSPQDVKKPILVNVTTIIGTHVGPNGLGFAAVVK
jgi:DegV family protein with EDD domain